jgi:hypothetical protein
MKKLTVLGPLLFWLVVTALPANALERSLNLRLGLEHTDNGEKTDVDEISDTEQQAGLDFSLTHEGKSLRAEIDYDVTRNSYKNNTQDGNTNINGQFRLTYEPLEGSVFVRLDSSTQNIVNDKAAVDIADNRQNRTITTLAPEWILRPSQADQVSLGLSHSDIQYEDGEQDSDRSGANIKWTRLLSTVDSAYAQLSYSDVQFDVAEQDYEYYQGYFNYTAALSRINYTISVGFNETKRDSGNGLGEIGPDDTNGGFLDAEFSYKGASSTWGLEIGRELTDTSQGNNNDGLDQFSNFQNANSTVDIYELTTVRASWSDSSVCTACTFRAYLSYEEEDYEVLPNDSEELSANVGFSYDLSRFTTLSLNTTYSDFSFADGFGDNNDYSRVQSRVQFSRKFGKDLSVQLFARYEERDSRGAVGNYEELIGGISLRYVLF